MMRMIKNRIILLLCSVVVATGVILINMSCTNSPSGALEYNTMSYYINGKFHDSIPDSIVRKEYGIVIQEQNGFEHSKQKKPRLNIWLKTIREDGNECKHYNITCNSDNPLDVFNHL